MTTLPDPSIPPPSWQKHLRWQSTPPFRIKWLTISETKFRHVSHLKNSYNEGQAVLVGRDGQEIEEECGRRLCALMDGEDREKGERDERWW